MTRDVASWRGVVIVAVLLFGLVIGSWMLTTSWWNKRGTALVRNGRIAQADGLRFGRGATASHCVDETLARYARTPPDPGTLGTERTFLQACLRVTAAAPEVCQPVAGASPPSDDWLAHVCTARDVSDASCPKLLRPLADYCSTGAHGHSPQE